MNKIYFLTLFLLLSIVISKKVKYVKVKSGSTGKGVTDSYLGGSAITVVNSSSSANKLDSNVIYSSKTQSNQFNLPVNNAALI